MDSMRIMVANEPRSYREVIAEVFQQLRPEHEVILTMPDSLDAEIIRLDPHLVVCSQLSVAVQTHPFTWVLLYPSGETRVQICINGQTMNEPGDIEFSNLITVVDRTARLMQQV